MDTPGDIDPRGCFIAVHREFQRIRRPITVKHDHRWPIKEVVFPAIPFHLAIRIYIRPFDSDDAARRLNIDFTARPDRTAGVNTFRRQDCRIRPDDDTAAVSVTVNRRLILQRNVALRPYHNGGSILRQIHRGEHVSIIPGFRHAAHRDAVRRFSFVCRNRRRDAFVRAVNRSPGGRHRERRDHSRGRRGPDKSVFSSSFTLHGIHFSFDTRPGGALGYLSHFRGGSRGAGKASRSRGASSCQMLFTNLINLNFTLSVN